MPGILFAVLTVLSWGTWLAPSQTVPFKNQQIKTFYVALANLVLAFFVGLFQGFHNLTFDTFWFPFAGGLIWAVSGYCAFLGTSRIGIARAIGIWAPLNIIVSIIWGIVLFGEFLKAGTIGIIVSIASVAAIIGGIILIIIAKDTRQENKADNGAAPSDAANKQDDAGKRLVTSGITGAVVAGILWGSYFIPIRISSVSMWVAAFPLAVGIFIGSLILVIFTRTSIFLEKPSHYVRVCITGILWGIGNYTSLRMMELIGTGKGFTIAQLNVALNALFGIFIFKQPRPKSRAALITIAGIIIALAGALVLGSLK
jgi:glucose uptake protein